MLLKINKLIRIKNLQRQGRYFIWLRTLPWNNLKMNKLPGLRIWKPPSLSGLLQYVLTSFPAPTQSPLECILNRGREIPLKPKSVRIPLLDSKPSNTVFCRTQSYNDPQCDLALCFSEIISYSSPSWTSLILPQSSLNTTIRAGPFAVMVPPKSYLLYHLQITVQIPVFFFPDTSPFLSNDTLI